MPIKKKMAIYLAGAMEKANNLGAGWRTELTPFLEKLNLDVLNPCEFEPEQLKGLQPNRLPKFIETKDRKDFSPKHWHELKHSIEPKFYRRFLKYMRRIIKYDIKILKYSADYVIVFWDESTSKGAGTHSELTAAFLRNIPVYCVAECEMPGWSMACCTEIFKNFDELKEFLKEEFEYEETSNNSA